MRLNTSPSAEASVLTKSVLAVPGMPVIRQCPPISKVTNRLSITSSWPTMMSRTCSRMRSIEAEKEATRSSVMAVSASASKVVFIRGS